jgi:hypothetical protein
MSVRVIRVVSAMSPGESALPPRTDIASQEPMACGQSDRKARKIMKRAWVQKLFRLNSYPANYSTLLALCGNGRTR